MTAYQRIRSNMHKMDRATLAYIKRACAGDFNGGYRPFLLSKPMSNAIDRLLAKKLIKSGGKSRLGYWRGYVVTPKGRRSR